MDETTHERRKAQLVAMLDDIDQRLRKQYASVKPMTAPRRKRIDRYEAARKALLELIEVYGEAAAKRFPKSS